jgi:hypothetical protein
MFGAIVVIAIIAIIAAAYFWGTPEKPTPSRSDTTMSSKTPESVPPGLLPDPPEREPGATPKSEEIARATPGSSGDERAAERRGGEPSRRNAQRRTRNGERGVNATEFIQRLTLTYVEGCRGAGSSRTGDDFAGDRHVSPRRGVGGCRRGPVTIGSRSN